MKLLLAALLLVSCAVSGYQTSFKSFYDYKRLDDAVYLKEGDTVKVYGVENFEAATRMALSRKFIPIGSSEFTGVEETEANAITQAKRVGATHMLIDAKFSNLQLKATEMYVPVYNTYNYNNYSGYYGVGFGYHGGLYSVADVENEEMYSQKAVYFVKSTKKFVVGLYFKDLTDQTKKEINSENGAVVDVIIDDTPAIKSDIQIGDVVLKFNNKEVKHASSIIKMIKKLPKDTKSIPLEIIRNKEVKTIEIVLD